MQRQSTIRIARFQRLSMIKILPKADIQAKKATLGEMQVFQIPFQGKFLEHPLPFTRAQ
jgi:hypothetical protein